MKRAIASCITGVSYDMLKVQLITVINTIFIGVIMYLVMLLKSLFTNISVTSVCILVSIPGAVYYQEHIMIMRRRREREGARITHAKD